MKRKQENFLLLVLTIILLILINGICFSPGFLNWSLTDMSNSMGFAGAWALLFCDMALVGYEVNLCLKDTDTHTLIETKSTNAEDYFDLIEELPNNYSIEQDTLKKTIRLFDAKIVQINELLIQVFGNSTYTLDKYNSTIQSSQKVFYDTVVNILNRIKFDSDLNNKEIIHESLNNLSLINRNADKLISELLTLNESDSHSTNVIAMENMQELIDNTKLYQQH